MRVCLLLLLLTWCPLNLLRAQLLVDFSNCKNYKDSIQAFALRCDREIRSETYRNLIPLSTIGFKILHQDDDANRSLCYFYKATGFYGADEVGDRVENLLLSQDFSARARDTNRLLEAQKLLLDAYNGSSKYAKEQQQLADGMEWALNHTNKANFKLKMLTPLANYYHQKGRYEEEMNCQMLGIELLKRRQGTVEANAADTSNIGVSLFNLGEVNMLLHNTEKARQYFSESIGYFHDYNLGTASAYKAMLAAFLEEDNLTAAYLYQDSLICLFKGDFEEWSVLINGYLDFGDFFLKKKKNGSVESYLRKAEILLKKHPDDFMQTQYDFVMGKWLCSKGDFERALHFLKSAAPDIAGVGVNSQLEWMVTMAQCQSGLGNWKEASSYYAQYVPLRDSTFREAARQSITNAEAKFQNKEKQQQIEVKNAELLYSKRQRFGLLLGIALLGLVVTLLIINFRNKKKTADLLNAKNKSLSQLNSELETANQTKAKLFGIISHDLRSPISQVYQFLHLQKTNPHRLDEAEKDKLSEKIEAATASLLQSMEDLLMWSKTQMNHFTVKPQTTEIHELLTETLALLHLHIDAKSLRILNEVSGKVVRKTDPSFLQTIIRNLLQNAINSAPEYSEIRIGYVGSVLFIENEGGGLSQEQYERMVTGELQQNALSGLGLKVVAELSEKLGIIVQFSQIKRGITRAELCFLHQETTLS